MKLRTLLYVDDLEIASLKNVNNSPTPVKEKNPQDFKSARTK